MSKINVAIVGTGIFASKAHLPVLQKSEYFTPYSCYNRTKAKAEEFAKKDANIEKVYDTLEAVFEDPNVDLVDALLPVQYNVDALKLAVTHKKNICLEKPIAANIDQAKELVQLARDHPEISVTILEHWSYYKAVTELSNAIAQIGTVYSFTYHATGPFNYDNAYLNTSWRQKPEHVGGFLSDGGVHQLAFLTGVLGNIKTVSAHTRQVREQSGTDDIAYALLETEAGQIGTFTYGSAFGNTKKSCFFEILGDNGSVYHDFSPGSDRSITLRLGGATASTKNEEHVIPIKNEYVSVDREFEVLGQALSSNNWSLIKTTPEVCFHHLSIVDAIVRSSEKNGALVEVTKP
ncbi:hypothetical protein OGAPHI_004983 [Ogataea philodendri]|uniref:NAD(P)-binding protein n=1 Tax=Ogataea philodendri TaxID=1378263 RepID=A0A9P8P2G3_9ASCO|nr:uncharacterized protein OGAPHI_004983 [Ogataea philodendri]KAH3663582.1 hypothetical protein OGAPHI_004983 [Ogataea philodendri]